MPNARVTYTSNGVQPTFTFNFPFIAEEHIHLYVNTIEATYTLDNATTLRPDVIPANGATVRIQRITPVDEPIVVFSDTSNPVADGYNLAFLQTLYRQQELEDQTDDYLSKDLSGNFDADGAKLINLADAVALTDATNLQTIQSFTQDAEDSAEAAAASATAAANSAAETAASLAVLDTKGGLLSHDGTAPAQLSPSTNGLVLTLNSATTTGLAWSGINNTSWSGTALSIANGGTGATSAGAARTALELGTLATASSINNANWSGTVLSVANGGTGSANASDARTALGLAIGTNVQAYNVRLQNFSGLTSTADGSIRNIPYFTNGTTLSNAVAYDYSLNLLENSDASGWQDDLNLLPGTDILAYNSALQAIGDLEGTVQANEITYFTAGAPSIAAARTGLTAFGRSLIDDADASTARTTLGLTIGTNVQAYNANLQAFSGLANLADQIPMFDGSTIVTKTLTGLAQSLIFQETEADMRSVLGLGSISLLNAIAIANITATGTPSASTFLRGDGAWVTPTGSGDVVGPASATSRSIALFDGTTGKLLKNGPSLGSSNQVLASNGAGADPSFKDLGTIYPRYGVLLATVTASASVSMNFTTGINSTYDEYILVLSDIVPATGDTTINLRVSEDGGSTWKSGAADYKYELTDQFTGGANVNTASAAASAMILGVQVGNGAGSSLCAHIRFWNPSGTTRRKKFLFQQSFETNANNMAFGSGGGAYVGTLNAINALQVLAGSGNITSGVGRLYGVRAS